MNDVIGVKFGGYDLQSGGVVIEETDVWSPPDREIQAAELAGRDGALVVQQRYRSKRFSIRGHIQKPTRVEADQARDAFLVAVSTKNTSFDIDHGSSIRRYLASANNVGLTRPTPTTFLFDVEFLSPDGMGWDIDTTQILAPTNVSTTAASIPITVGGTYQSEPMITLIMSSLTGGTNRTVTVRNGETMRGLSITRDWSLGDTLEINSLKKSVYINGVTTMFTGQFPVFEPGQRILGYVDDLTSRSASLSMSHIQRWL